MAPPQPPPVPIPLFPAAPNVNLVTDQKLQDALLAVTKGLTNKDYGLTIVDTGKAAAGTSNFPSASVNGDVEHYAASMLKVACMYAAFALRDLAQRFNMARKPTDPDDFFRKIKDELDPLIEVCCPMITGHAPSVRLPKWRDMFAATGNSKALNVHFAHDYATSMVKMIVPSKNEDAGRCIRGVGYAYLNGLMLKHGFFDDAPKARKGIWLAGDYGGSEVVTISCDNDVDTKQGATSNTMARLGLAIFVQRILPGTSSGQMVQLLKMSAEGSDSSYFTRTEIFTDPAQKALTHKQVTHGKIGLGELKSKRKVFSDLNAINDPIGQGGDFTVCYTNIDYNPHSIQEVLQVIRDTMGIYQGGAAAPPAAAAPAAPPASAIAPAAQRNP